MTPRRATVYWALAALLALRLLWNLASGAGMFWDFINFYNAGTRTLHGEFASLYQTPAPIAGGTSIGPGRLDYVGFPISAFAFAPLGMLAPRAALVAFKAACAVCFGLGLLIMFRYCRDRFGEFWRSDAAVCFYLLLILLFEPFWFVFTIGGQATPLVFLLLALLLSSYTAGRFWLSAAWLSIAILLKPVLALMTIVFLFAGAWPLLVRLGGCLAAEGALSWLVFGWQLHMEWARMVMQESTRWSVAWWNNGSILGAVANFWIYNGDPQFGLVPMPRAFAATETVFRVLLVLLFFWLVRRSARRAGTIEERHEDQVFLAILFPLFLSTIVWPHYLAIVFLPLVVFSAQYPRLSWLGRLLVVLTLISTARARLPFVIWVYDALPTDGPWQLLLAGVVGSGTLILMLVLSVAYVFRTLGNADRPERA